MASKIHRNIQITGRVQGVFFRQSARKEALDLGLTGFVQNRPDGSVYGEVEGTADAIDRFMNWCKKGPPAAQVASVETTDGVLEHFPDFQIRKTV